MIGYLHKAITPLVLIMPKMSGYVKTFKVKDGSNKLMYFNNIDDEKLLEKYKAIWTKIKNLKNVRLNNTISLSCHEQVCLSGLCFERYLFMT